jgi:pilus assembly protein CpaF
MARLILTTSSVGSGPQPGEDESKSHPATDGELTRNVQPEQMEKLHREVISRIDLNRNCLDAESREGLKSKADKEIESILSIEKVPPSIRREVKCELLEEIFLLGPLSRLLGDHTISEIMVIGHKDVYVERHGIIEKTVHRFISERTLLSIIDRIAAQANRRIDESSPCVDARLPDGSRVHAIIPPLSLSGPILTIRKFTLGSLTFHDLVQRECITEECRSYLESMVKERANIVVAGGTGTGKTTLLNILSSFIPDDERIITIEDSGELRIQKPHVVSLESRPPNLEGKGEVTIRELVRNSLRMRPDRIIVGECRGGEALDMLQAMNTGHDGSMTTAHANSPRDLLSRLETMVLFSGLELPVRAVREQIASAIDLIIFLARGMEGKRRIVSATEINGMSDLTILTQEIFTLSRGGGNLARTGIPSRFKEG